MEIPNSRSCKNFNANCDCEKTASVPPFIGIRLLRLLNVGASIFQEVNMKPNLFAFALSLCAATMLIAPDAAQAFRGGGRGGGFHGGGFHGGGRWAGGGRGWHGGGGRWAGGGWHGGGYHGGYWRGGRWYGGGGWGWGAAAAGAAVGAAAVGAAAYGSCYQQQTVWNGYQYVTQWVRVC
jgi:hypothetical protein